MPNAKKKGNAGENAFANFLSENGIKAYRNGASGAGINKSDVHNSIGFNFEVKTVKKLNLQEAWRQSSRDASMSHSTPSVVIHFDGMPKDEWLVVMHSNDFVDLVLKQIGGIEEKKEELPNSREINYKLERVKYAVKDLLKTIDKED